MSLAWKYNEEDEIGFSEKNNVYAELQPFVGLMNSVSTGGKKKTNISFVMNLLSPFEVLTSVINICCVRCVNKSFDLFGMI